MSPDQPIFPGQATQDDRSRNSERFHPDSSRPFVGRLDFAFDGNAATRRSQLGFFNYINFMVAVEIEFGVKFKVADIEFFENVGAIVAETKALLR